MTWVSVKFDVGPGGTSHLDARVYWGSRSTGSLVLSGIVGTAGSMSPSTTVVMGSLELPNFSTWQIAYVQCEAQPGIGIIDTCHQTIRVGPTSSGPWTVQCEGDFTRVPGSGFFNAQECSLIGAPTVPACEYGTTKIEPIGSIIEVTPALVGALLPLAVGGWAIPAVIATAGGVVALNTLCSGLPPAPQSINESDWLTRSAGFYPSVAHQKIADNFRNTMWHHFCKCNDAPSGMPVPVDPGNVDWTKPAYFVQYTTNNISNYDIANTLNLIMNIGSGNQTLNYYTGTQVANTHSCVCPEYLHGDVHEALTGTGVFSIGTLQGVEIQITAVPPNTYTQPGQPLYLWNMGWMSIENVDGMLDEKRITRTNQVWLPSSIHLANEFTYTLSPGVEITVTELVPPSP